MRFAGLFGRLSAALAAGLLVPLAAGCSSGGGGPVPCAGSKKPIVVAAENFWGSIATQIAGDKACVASIIVNPDTDPHAYEATPNDARLIATAKYFIENGAGYDPWAPKLLNANPVSGRVVLNVGDLNGVQEGGNPHMWYSPTYVDKVIDKITSDLQSIDSADASFFDDQKTQYKTVALKDYLDTIKAIKTKYARTPVGASESIFIYLADALGLNLTTPKEYMKAISEGTDPSPADKAEVQRQIDQKTIKVFVFNSQNTTKDVVALVNDAKAKDIPVPSVTETLTPAYLTFQDWQTKQLKDLQTALGG
ncbi:MAG TPA: zinc ABC transporter substrate-binding protein [Candidatus Dormibacteraeota bacterium]